MINISFDRPYLLLLAIPLIALTLVPFFIAIRKENKTRGAVISLVIHLLISALITVVAAGTSVTRVITETNVYVIADVSHSTSRDLDLIDSYIEDIKDELPQNSKMGVIAFGKNSRLITDLDEEFDTVRGSGVDDSATNIRGALEHAGSLFADNVVKRIILITDGKQTVDSSYNGIAASIDRLHAAGVYIDAIYLDENLDASTGEIQLTTVNFTPSTYLNHQTKANALIQSAKDSEINARVNLYKNGELIASQYPTLTRGYNVINFNLPTDESGTFDYRITVEADSSTPGLDSSTRNNSYTFTQEVAGKLNVLLISTKDTDVQRAAEIYGDGAIIDARISDPNVPYTVEELIRYDEIILSDTDVRNLKNYSSFISSLDTVVSGYGKSLLTFGDLSLQNKITEIPGEGKEDDVFEDTTNEILENLENMLPVNFGNNDQDPKLMCLVLDISRSMQTESKLLIEKAAAKQIVNLMRDEDFLIIIAFWGDKTTMWNSAQIGPNRDSINEAIDNIDPMQNTVLGAGMKLAFEKVKASSISDKQVFIMSDGVTWAQETDNAVELAEDLYLEGIPTSVLNTNTRDNGTYKNQTAIKLLQNIARAGAGLPLDTPISNVSNYFFCGEEKDVDDLILKQIADIVTDTVVEGDVSLSIRLRQDEALSGITTAIPNLKGFMYAKEKGSANTVLVANYTTAEGRNLEAPIYAWWKYGDGKVASFTSSFSGKWVEDWYDGAGRQLVENITDVNVPKEKHDVPFRVNIDDDGGIKRITITPERLSYTSKAAVLLKNPDGTTVEKELTFNSKNYVFEFSVEKVGKYTLDITYTPYDTPYTETLTVDVPYEKEYNAFVAFTISDLHKIIRTKGTVHTDSDIDLENKEEDIETYTFYFTVPFMAAAVILYVLDIIFRKLRWTDIRNLFGLKEKKIHKGGGAK